MVKRVDNHPSLLSRQAHNMINDVAADDYVDAKRRGAAGALPPLAEPAPRQRNPLDDARSEERRVGKEWRCRGAPAP